MTSRYDPRRPLKEASMPDRKSRSDKFKEATRALECDDVPERLCERVGKLVRHELVEEPE
jgi:hypothetical protein